jgi:dTDP-glucose 4,6-dehydratase/UDP-glucose 4-epimerase
MAPSLRTLRIAARSGFAEMTALHAYSGSNVLITGGLGFIGSNLARRLLGIGAQVTLVDSLIPEYGGNPFNVHDIRERVEINVCDVRDRYAMEYLLRGRDFLFNLAGQTSHLDSMESPEKDLEINAAAQLAILESCRRVNPGVRIAFASTRQLYGRPQYLPVDENHPVRPVDVNGINKLAGEYYHLLYSNVYGIPACALRLTNTYGPGMRVVDARQTFLGVWIRMLLEGRPVTVYGDGRQLRDFNYVDDCVEAILRAGLEPAATGQVLNLGSAEVVSLADLAALLVEVAGEGRVEMVPFPAARKAIDIGDYYGDFSKARATLGWEPRVGLAEGLRRTIDYYRVHRAEYWS